MKKHALLGLAWSLSVVVGAGTALSQPSSGPAGHWEGTIQTPGQELNIMVDLAGRGDGKWEGTITIPAQNVKGFVLSPVSVEGETITFGMKGVPGDPLFKGKISKEPRSISGEYTQGGAALPFTLAWKGEPKIEEAPAGTLTSLDQGGAEIPVTTISQNGSHVTLLVSSIGATYEGDLKEEQMDGTWAQSGQRFPLVFKRTPK
jgi:hypothetical protein